MGLPYSHMAAAKSAVGIGLPEMSKAHHRFSGFFMRKAQLHLNGELGGAALGLAGSL